jgi:tetratricopeptide (TPR) repeat protein
MAEKAKQAELDATAAVEEEEDFEIELIDLKGLTKKDKRLYDAAVNAYEQKNHAYAIDLLRTLLVKYPGLIEARMTLREVQMDKIGNKAAAGHQILANILAVANFIQCQIRIGRKKFAEALDAGEAAMSRDATASFPCIVLFRAAEAAGADAIGLMALEHAEKFHPKNRQILDWLSQIYIEMGMGKKALVCRQNILDANPGNMQAEAAVKEAVALAAMDEGGWERVARSDGTLDYRSLIKDTDAAVKLEQKGRTVKGGDAAVSLIDELMREIAVEDTIDRRKKVAELYLELNDFENGLLHYGRAFELSEGADPSIERAMTNIDAKQYDITIKEWRAYLKSEITEEEKQQAAATVEDLLVQKRKMLIERVDERVKRYPNDVPERFEYAKLLYDDGQVDEALPQFQVTQRNARFSQESMIFLGRCFAAKGQHDLAIDQYKTGIALLEVMNAVKKDALYSLATSFMEVGREAEGLEAYKEVYAADLGYKDVAKIIEESYSS